MLSNIRQRDRFSFSRFCILEGFELYLFFNPGRMSQQTFFSVTVSNSFCEDISLELIFLFFFQRGLSDEIAPFQVEGKSPPNLVSPCRSYTIDDPVLVANVVYILSLTINHNHIQALNILFYFPALHISRMPFT